MSEKTDNPESCQVDFYLLGDLSIEADRFVCKLAMMAWERRQKIFILGVTAATNKQLDELLWQYPEGRFLPHTLCGDPESAKAPITIGTLSDLKPTEVVINLCPEAVPQPQRFNRVLEIVPYADDKREASRQKYKFYRKLGLKPRTHEIGTPSR